MLPPQPAPAGLGCCIHKRHFDGMGSGRAHSGSTVIDMGTSSGPCPGRPGPVPAPPGSCSGECRRPWYHYTARNLTTSDPNGLQWRRTASGGVSYEFFHQDRGSYTKLHPEYCWGTGASRRKTASWSIRRALLTLLVQNRVTL